MLDHLKSMCIQNWQAPSFVFLHSNLHLYPDLDVQTQVVGNVSDGEGPQQRQALSFSVISVHRVHSTGDESKDVLYLFSDFSISSMGCLHARLRPMGTLSAAGDEFTRLGEIVAVIRLQDDGGTAWGGIDASENALPLVLHQEPKRLMIEAPGNVLMDEAESPVVSTLHSLYVGLIPYLQEIRTLVSCARESSDMNLQLPLQVAGVESAPQWHLEAVFEVIGVSERQLFIQQPDVDQDGTLTFELAPGSSGETAITTILRWKYAINDTLSQQRRGESESLPHTLVLQVRPLNLRPSFNLSSAVTLLEQADTAMYANFARDISAGRPSERDQKLTFNISIFDSKGLFQKPPSLSADGSLHFRSTAGAYGFAMLFITLVDELGAQSPQMTTNITVLPLPVVLSVYPLVVPTKGNISITILARHLHLTALGNEALCPHVAVYLGHAECLVLSVEQQALEDCTEVVAHEIITCMASAGSIGPATVEVSVTQEELYRNAQGPDVFFSHIIVAGTYTGDVRGQRGGQGFLAVGPRGAQQEAWPPQLEAGLLDAPVRFSGAVNALALLNHTLFVAGAFTKGGSPSSFSAWAEVKEPMSHIAAWSLGSTLTPLGLGLDGTVSHLCAMPSRSWLVVAGSFTRAFNMHAPFAVSSGGLALWEGRASEDAAAGSWGLLAAAVHGSVSSVLCNDILGEIFIGGAVKVEPTSGCASPSSASGLGGGMGLAMFDAQQGSWRSLAGAAGVVGGNILAMASIDDDLYVGGDFVSLSGLVAGGIAVCKQFRHDRLARWYPIASLDGSVRSVAACCCCLAPRASAAWVLLDRCLFGSSTSSLSSPLGSCLILQSPDALTPTHPQFLAATGAWCRMASPCTLLETFPLSTKCQPELRGASYVII